eukprot:Skav236696  [mRNA]  locus=scaffold4101:15250:21977:- [translate_table: standard]
MRYLRRLVACAFVLLLWSRRNLNLVTGTHQSLRIAQRTWPSQPVGAVRAVPWDQVPGAELLKQGEVLRAAALCTGRMVPVCFCWCFRPVGEDWQLMLPEEQQLTDLVDESFQRAIEARPEAPSLRKPRDDEWALGAAW